MVDSHKIKNIIFDLGADVCGIAPVERFIDMPAGFSPKDIYKETKSVVVFAKRVPNGSMLCDNRVVYTQVTATALMEIDRIAYNACCHMHKIGIDAVMIPSDDPYEYWDEENSDGKGILSLKHAGVLAGLGVMGKSTILINKDLGNMLQLGAILINVETEYDDVIDEDYCKNCKVCINNCPAGALDGKTVNQKLCRSIVTVKSSRGFSLYNCNKCRTLCPNALGAK
ncbi:MAG: 4Fe-4S binding protein [Solirubrobacterales bacterium]